MSARRHPRAPAHAIAHKVASGHAPHPPTPPTHSGGSSLLHTLGGLVGSFTNIFTGGVSHLLTSLPGKTASAIATALFNGVAEWVGHGAVYLLTGLGRAMSASTRPEIGTSYFTHELGVMAVTGATVAVPLLFLTAIQAVVQQEPGLLIRAVLLKVPLALVFTGIAVQLVSLGIAATDAISDAMLHAAGVPAGQLFTGLSKALGVLTPTGPVPQAAGLAVALAVVFGALVLWLELALRAASIEAATLFLPLALAGVVWPATSHWARRLGETLAALVLSKVVVVGVLALAVGDLAASGGGGLAAVVSGIALLLLAVFSPYALLRLVPAVGNGTIDHLQGLAGQHAMRGARAAKSALSAGAGAVSGVGGAGAAGAAGPMVADGIGMGVASGDGPSGESQGSAKARGAPPGQLWADTPGLGAPLPGSDDEQPGESGSSAAGGGGGPGGAAGGSANQGTWPPPRPASCIAAEEAAERSAGSSGGGATSGAGTSASAGSMSGGAAAADRGSGSGTWPSHGSGATRAASWPPRPPEFPTSGGIAPHGGSPRQSDSEGVDDDGI